MDARSQLTAATRARVLDAALDVLAERGVDGVTMQAVAERADVALRTIYNHFPTKDALVIEAYNRSADAVQQAFAALPSDGETRARLGWIVDALYDVFEHEGPGYGAMLGVTGIPEFTARLQAVRAWRRRELTAIVKQASHEGTLRLPVKQAAAIVFLMTAYATWHSMVRESEVPPSTAKQLARQVIDDTLFGITDA